MLLNGMSDDVTSVRDTAFKARLEVDRCLLFVVLVQKPRFFLSPFLSGGGRHSNAGIKKCLWAALGSVSKFAARLGTDLSSLLIHLGRNRLGLGRHLPRPCKAAQTITKHFGSSHTALLLPPLEEAGSEGLQREAQASTTSVTTCHCLQWSEYPAPPSYESDAATKGFTCSQLVTLRMMLDVEEPSVHQQMCLRHSCSISLYRHETKDQLSHKMLSSLGPGPELPSFVAAPGSQPPTCLLRLLVRASSMWTGAFDMVPSNSWASCRSFFRRVAVGRAVDGLWRAWSVQMWFSHV